MNINQQNRLHLYYLIYIGDDGRVLVQHTEVKRLLDLARAACRGRKEPMAEAYPIFNAATNDGRDMQPYSDLLDRAIHTMIEHKEEGDINSLFTADRTTALVHTISGLDDFELINFLVVMGQEPASPERRRAAARRLHALFAHIPKDVSLADELIAERRAEAARENVESGIPDEEDSQ